MRRLGLGRAPFGALSLSLGLLLASTTAQAHFKLLKPVSWINEDNGGNPQKASPCGPGALDSISATGAITEFKAGAEITVEWTDTIAHPGYFRIALAKNRDDLKDPTIKQGLDCSFDETKVPKTASGNVLADGVAFRSREGFSDAAGKKFSQKVKLPTEPCDKCTLQVMQVMENDLQTISNCYYFHCADIKIVKDTGGDGDGDTGGGTVILTDAGMLEPSGDGDDSTGDGDDAEHGDGSHASHGDGDGDSKGPSAAPAKSESSCAVSAPNGSNNGWFFSAIALGLSLALGRRAKRRATKV